MNNDDLFEELYLRLKQAESLGTGITLTKEDVKILVEDIDETNEMLKEFSDTVFNISIGKKGLN